MTCHDGIYYATITDGQRIFLRCAPSVHRLFEQVPTRVWAAPRTGPASKHLWAPELHRLEDQWFIYYAADDGCNRNHRLWVLEAVGDDPAGPYRQRGMLRTGGWSIDATVFRVPGGSPILFWSGWEGGNPGPQNLYAAALSDPLTLAGPRTLLSRPIRPWEQGVAAVCEGPAVLCHGPLTCLVYSAGASWSVHSCLGMLVHRGGDFLDPAAWTKVGPVFARTSEVWGIGHCSLLGDEEGGILFYHAKTRRTRGWRDRNIRAQRFTWDDGGLPSFGEPEPVPNVGVSCR